MAGEEFLGEFLAGLKLGALFFGPPAGNPDTFAGVGEAFAQDEVTFFARDAEVDAVGGHPVDEAVEAGGGYRCGDLEDGVASGVAIKFGGGGGVVEGFDQCVLTPALADNCDFHARDYAGRGDGGQAFCLPEELLENTRLISL